MAKALATLPSKATSSGSPVLTSSLADLDRHHAALLHDPQEISPLACWLRQQDIFGAAYALILELLPLMPLHRGERPVGRWQRSA